MIAQIRAELRKLLSVRSTYIMLAIALVLLSLFAFVGTSATTYEEGTCDATGEVVYSTKGMNFADPDWSGAQTKECEGEMSFVEHKDTTLRQETLVYTMQETMPLIATFAAIVVVLLMAHEFRYNTINYTLTISRSRSKVLLAKLIVSTLLTVAFVAIALVVAVATTQLAIAVKGLTLPPQDYNWWYIIARHLGYALGQTLIFLAVITLVRSLTAGIAAVFLLPTVEQIGGFLLATRDIEPTKFLPFSALDRFGAVASDVVSNNQANQFMATGSTEQASMLMAGGVFLAYLVGVWIITWIMFLRRDAN